APALTAARSRLKKPARPATAIRSTMFIHPLRTGTRPSPASLCSAPSPESGARDSQRRPPALLSPLARSRGEGWGRDGASGKAGNVGGFLGDEFEKRRLALAGLGDAALDRLLDLARLSNPLAIAAERLGEIGVIAADVGRAVLLGRDRHHLQFDRHREIVR